MNTPIYQHLARLLWLAVMVSLLVSMAQGSGMLVLSDVTNNIYVGVRGKRDVRYDVVEWMTNNAPLSYEDNMLVLFFCTTGTVRIRCHPYRYVSIQMRDPEGRTVAKSAEGRRWGADIYSIRSLLGRNNRRRMVYLNATHSPKAAVVVPVSGPMLPSPRELFEMKKGGIYSLTMEVHLMKKRLLTNGWTWDPITIPPFSVKVEKPPDGQP